MHGEFNIDSLVYKLKQSEINGYDLAQLVAEGKITKAERRKITRTISKPDITLTERQRLRLEAKEKKTLPKLTKEDRHRKYVIEKNDELREKKRQKTMTCLGCRESGHVLKYCPNISLSISVKKVFCFNCGQSDHALRHCASPQTPGYLPFAECFICKEKGHISKDCTQNPNGLYPHGGCCHICNRKDHIVKDCPQKGKEVIAEADEKLGNEVRVERVTEFDRSGDYIADETEYTQEEEGETQSRKKKKSKAKKLGVKS